MKDRQRGQRGAIQESQRQQQQRTWKSSKESEGKRERMREQGADVNSFNVGAKFNRGLAAQPAQPVNGFTQVVVEIAWALAQHNRFLRDFLRLKSKQFTRMMTERFQHQLPMKAP